MPSPRPQTSDGFSSRTLATIDALAETLLPRVPDAKAWFATPLDLGIPGRFADLVGRLPHPSVRRELNSFLRLLASGAGGLFLYGKPRPFPSLSPSERVEAILRMGASPLVGVRKGAKFLKVLLAMPWATTGSPVWDAMGYPGPDGPAPEIPKAIVPAVVKGDETWTADVVVVGSGAGGGVAAGILAQAGLEVVVLEKGGYRNEADFTHLEEQAYRDLYLDGLLSTTTDGGFAMIAGSTLGGGTVVNWTTSFSTPEMLRQAWDQVAGFSGVFTGRDYESASQAVSKRLGLNTVYSTASNRDAVLELGLSRLGWHVDAQPRNVEGCLPRSCGYCTLGCRLGAKRSTLVTYLPDAFEAGARIVPDAEVRKVLIEGNRAVGVEAVVNGSRLRVRSAAVVLAAAALNTPAIMLRSGVGGRAVGSHLHLHPVTGVWGRFPDPVDPWTGMMQSRYSGEFADLDGRGYGFILETGPIHPVLAASYIGWESPEQFGGDVLDLRHLCPVGILLRDRSSGNVSVRRDGSPRWTYRMTAADTAHMRLGVQRAAEVLAAAGATEVIASTIRPVRWRPGANAPVEGFMNDVDSVGYGPNQMSYASLHQMGGARMGRDHSSSVVGEDNQAHDTPGLFVMDGSCFPTASGVNPMITIATIAHRAATNLASRLT